jgi:predicted dinucleotide-binding enzyme
VITLALPGAAAPAFAGDHRRYLDGKTIIDTTNNVQNIPMHSLDILSETAPNTRLVRAFNSLGWENFAEPLIDGVQVDHFFCCAVGVRTLAEQLIADIGLRPIYIGGVDKADVLDGLTRLWFALTSSGGYDRHTALNLLAEGS